MGDAGEAIAARDGCGERQQGKVVVGKGTGWM